MLKPNEPISYGSGQQLYIQYNESSIWWDEQIDLVDLQLNNEEIYFGRLADELIRYSRIRMFILNPRNFALLKKQILIRKKSKI